MDRETALEKILASSNLDGMSRDFFRRVYATPQEVYRNRLRAIRFSDKDRVLDAGCGVGQWSMALAYLNKHVYAIDISEARVDVTKQVARLWHYDIDVRVGSITQPSYENNYFDAIFCYGALFYTPWIDTLKVFYGLLRDNGRLYVNANGLGWYIHLWKNAPNETEGYDPRKVAAMAFKNTYKYQRHLPTIDGTDIIIEPQELMSGMSHVGFDVSCFGPEGTASVADVAGHSNRPFFSGEYEGHTGIHECVGVKRVTDCC